MSGSNLVRLGNTGLRVSRLCLGTMTFGSNADERESVAILDAATEVGVNFIDTANRYPSDAPDERKGLTEEIIGRWMKGRRQRFIVTTKAGGPMGPLPWDAGTSRKHLLGAIDASLARLGTDYVDLFQLHRDDPSTPLDETLEAIDTIVRSGRSRYVGVSNWGRPWQSDRELCRRSRDPVQKGQGPRGSGPHAGAHGAAEALGQRGEDKNLQGTGRAVRLPGVHVWADVLEDDWQGAPCDGGRRRRAFAAWWKRSTT